MFTTKRQHKTLNQILENNDSEAVDIVKNLFRSIDKMNTATEIINHLNQMEIALYGKTNPEKNAQLVYAKLGIN